MPTYAPSWEQTSPSPPPFAHGGGGGSLTHRENEGAGAHVLPAESGQQLSEGERLSLRGSVQLAIVLMAKVDCNNAPVRVRSILVVFSKLDENHLSLFI
jgi:hypothetical protein